MGDPRRRHVVVSAPSQWGQQACDHLLHRAVANGGRVTLIVPRREQVRFDTVPPTFKEGRNQPSLGRWLEEKRASGSPIDFVYDDQCNHLAAALISQRSLETHLTVGYVTSSADDHLNHATYLSQFCERVLVEKPVSRVFSEIRTGGGFPDLAMKLSARPPDRTCRLMTADHYLFRPGVEHAMASLQGFVKRHRNCPLRYEFHFEEPAGRDDPGQRVGAYQDGSILDILVPHGFGPVACLLLPMLGVGMQQFDFDTALTWLHVQGWQARGYREGPLKVPVLAETAAELRGALRIPDRQTLDLELHSAKGCKDYMRFFKLSCPIGTCLQPRDAAGYRTMKGRSAVANREDEIPCSFVGVSLGSVGFTVFDPGDAATPNGLFVQWDGGYKSDSRGSISEAAIAQAAMLDALLGDEFLKENGRFVPVETACQLIRVGLRAQGVACNQERKPYTWGKGPWDKEHWSKRQDAARNSDGLKGIEPRLLGNSSPGIAQLREVLGWPNEAPAEQVPYHRIVTILGSEGTGNSDVARALSKQLGALRIDIPRDEDWEQRSGSKPGSPPPSHFTLEMVLRKLAEHLHLPLTTALRPAEELPVYLRKVSPKDTGALLLFNGADRLQDQDWQVLVRILNQLATRYRMILVTKTWHRAAGFVVRTEELIRELPELEMLRKPPLETYLPAECQAAEEKYDWLLGKVHKFCKQNVTALQQVASYVFYIALPAALEKVVGQPDPRTLASLGAVQWQAVREHIEVEIASLDIPSPLTAHPEEFLDRVSSLSLAMVGETRREAVRSLAAISGEIPKTLVEEILPGLFGELIEGRPVRALFEAVGKHPPRALLFPRVRHAALTSMPEGLARLRGEIERRRLILSLRRLREDATDAAERRELDEQMIRLFYGASLESLNLDQSPFETWCMERIEGLETSSDLHGDQAAGSLIELLTDESSLIKTNLGLLARARLTRLKGWVMRSAAGTDPARLHEVGKVLDHAVALAQYCARKEIRPSEHERQISDTLVLTLQARVFAGLVQSSCWHRLFGVGTLPPATKQSWEEFVAVPLVTSETTRNLWRLCGLESEQDGPSQGNLSNEVLAIAIRTLALYTAYVAVQEADSTAAKERWKRAAWLCLWAAHYNADSAATDCRARNLLEAAVLLPDNVDIDDRWDLAKGKGKVTRSVLQAQADKDFAAPERRNHPGLAPYMDLLNLVIRSRCAGEGPQVDPEEIERLREDFERTGEGYFSQLMHDMLTFGLRPGSC